MLSIVHYPHPSLLKKCDIVNIFDDDLKNIAEKMILTMKANKGIGLAANQVNINKRMFVMYSDDKDYIIINPVIKFLSDENMTFEEGCLSFPNISQKTNRARTVLLQWQDIQGNLHEKEFHDVAAICIQHEIDHLDGITFIDNLSPLKKQFVLKKYKKNFN